MSCTHFVLLLLALSAYLAHSDVFTSIDCGSSEIYNDDRLITWTGDDTLISNGLAQTVQIRNSFSPPMDTLRVFTTRKKNCYLVEVEEGGQVLIRASFFYGNYDKKSSPPTFDLHFDGNFWATVETSTTDVVYYEAIYAVKSDILSVCVAQTKPKQFPFISALEVRSLHRNMYSHVDANFALFLNTRVAYGTNETVRFVDDEYDRIWTPSIIGDGLLKVQNEAFSISTDVEDIPPEAVLKNAITTPTKSQYITLNPKFPSTETSIYITMYFSEVTQLDSTQQRSFMVYQNNISISDTIVPPYEGVYEFIGGNITASSGTSFSVMATSTSDLPPLVNAVEVYYVSDLLTEGTNGNDVQGLVSLQNTFEVLQEWSGEPCLPATYTWDWLNCSTNSTPRVTSLDLSSFGLSGLLPDFSTMTALETIDLHNNSLYGAIPDFLGDLPNLKELNLGDNQFSGPIPTSLSRNNKIKLVVTGNPNVCASGKSCQVIDSPTSNDSPTTFTDTTTKKSKNKLPVILGVSIPIFVIFWVIVAVLAILNHKRKSSAVAMAETGHNADNGTPQSQSSMLGKFGEAMINEMKQNPEQGNVTINFSDETDQQPATQGNEQYNGHT